MTPLNCLKGTVWEGGVRVPCIVRFPEILPAGTTTTQVAITMDWTATFRRLAGLGLDPDGADGMDIFPILTGQKPVQERTLFWRRTNRRAQKNVELGRVVRKGNWKLIERDGVEPELFDLSIDVGETRNLIDRNPELASEMTRELDDWEHRIANSLP